ARRRRASTDRRRGRRTADGGRRGGAARAAECRRGRPPAGSRHRRPGRGPGRGRSTRGGADAPAAPRRGPARAPRALGRGGEHERRLPRARRLDERRLRGTADPRGELAPERPLRARAGEPTAARARHVPGGAAADPRRARHPVPGAGGARTSSFRSAPRTWRAACRRRRPSLPPARGDLAGGRVL
ncbi:MAG: hypothetical protein AVDCRST_MAG79-1973, partial [uncultured Thermoleophilia bacterium]